MDRLPRVLISACLAGVPCRYDAKPQAITGLDRLAERCALIPVCPEQLGGLPTPRTPAEKRGGRVLDRNGRDVTRAFESGATQAVRIAKLCGADLALLKSRSPSCGRGLIYDGSFSGRLVPGDGVTAKSLLSIGLPVYTEEELDALLCDLEEIRHDKV